MNLNGTESKRNIQAALTGESLARNKYTFYAMQAKKEGLPEIAELFDRMATNESHHAKIWFQLLNEGMKPTKANLTDAAKGENSEWMSMYPKFAETARKEGFDDLATMFERVATIEKDHEKTFLQALVTLFAEKKEVPEKIIAKPTEKIGYRCMFCGATFDKRPDVCPVCEAIGSFERCTIVE